MLNNSISLFLWQFMKKNHKFEKKKFSTKSFYNEKHFKFYKTDVL